MDLTYRPAVEQAAAIRRGDVTSRDLLEATLDRLDRLDSTTNAVVVRRDGVARELADAADSAVREDRATGAFHGVPVTVKECFSVAGMPTTAGAPVWADHVAREDAVAVSRIVAAGAIVYGKTNTPYLADDLQTYNDVYGTTSNPWDTTRTPGGSSGGSAAAVASGFTPIELGSDIGGSIRNPASMCGVYGHKPSWGLVPIRGHVPGPPGQRSVPDLAVAGPLARSAADLGIVLDIIAGPDEWDAPAWSTALPPSRHDSLSEFTVGVLLDSDIAPVSSEVTDVVGDAVDALARAGVAMTDSLPDISLAAAHRIYLQLMYGQEAGNFSRSARARRDEAFDDLDDTSSDRLSMLTRGVSQRHRHWLAVNERRQRLRSAWHEWFTNVDLLICPVSTVVAQPHDHGPMSGRSHMIDGDVRDYWDPLFWAGLATGPLLPATALPAGIGRGGLPVGMQVIGPYLEDHTAIRFAELAASELGGPQRPPGY